MTESLIWLIEKLRLFLKQSKNLLVTILRSKYILQGVAVSDIWVSRMEKRCHGQQLPMACVWKCDSNIKFKQQIQTWNKIPIFETLSKIRKAKYVNENLNPLCT